MFAFASSASIGLRGTRSVRPKDTQWWDNGILLSLTCARCTHWVSEMSLERQQNSGVASTDVRSESVRMFHWKSQASYSDKQSISSFFQESIDMLRLVHDSASNCTCTLSGFPTSLEMSRHTSAHKHKNASSTRFDRDRKIEKNEVKKVTAQEGSKPQPCKRHCTPKRLQSARSLAHSLACMQQRSVAVFFFCHFTHCNCINRSR